MLDRMLIGSPALMVFALVKVFAYHIEFNPYCHFVIRSFRITYFHTMNSRRRRDIGIKEMKKVARNFNEETNEGRLSGAKYAIVAANNHYAGFAPGTVNIFRQLLGLEEVKWGDEFVSSDDLEKDDVIGVNKRGPIKTKQSI